MKQLFTLLLAAVLCVSLGAASADWTDTWAEGFPDWTVDVHARAYQGQEGSCTLYEIMMTRVEDGALIQLHLVGLITGIVIEKPVAALFRS